MWLRLIEKANESKSTWLITISMVLVVTMIVAHQGLKGWKRRGSL